jgi:hypothetical protein
VLGLARGRLVGGIDFGWRNPFAAVWGALEEADVLWLVGERYKRHTPLHQHRDALKALGSYTWHADPAGATEIAELRSADLKVRKADNDIRLGLAAVTARVQSGRLRVSRTGCPYLIAEAKLYRYPSEAERRAGHRAEVPVDDNNHALGALRYMVASIDQRFIARLRKTAPKAEGREEDADAVAAALRQEDERKRQQRLREAQASVFGVRRELWDDPEVWS